MRIFGIDPGLATVGFGIVDKGARGELAAVDYGVVTTPKELTTIDRLVILHEAFGALLTKYAPDAVAVEELFFARNVTTGIPVAEARGVLLMTVRAFTANLFEYTPLQVKMSITGYGQADKGQIQFMVQRMLRLKVVPKPDDAADALAIAITHANTNMSLVAAKK
ncbi:MAG: crossover junction endodeoxyribonuclease RuvC [Clostridiales bacterium]|jgi:crossover junction endodeoxyribonuclease RuvC|nr:crossover junction endodeoxyribonuclease RuvC [Clostridiales bacterium]